MHPVLKVAITAILIVIISEVSKRTGYLGGLIASLPRRRRDLTEQHRQPEASLWTGETSSGRNGLFPEMP